MADPTAWEWFSRIMGIWGGTIGSVLGYFTLKKNLKTRVIVKADVRFLFQFSIANNQHVKYEVPFLFVSVINHLDHAITVDCMSFIPTVKGVDNAALMNVRHDKTNTTWAFPHEIKSHAKASFPVPWEELQKLRQFDGKGARLSISVSTGESYRGPLLKREPPRNEPPKALPVPPIDVRRMNELKIEEQKAKPNG